MIDVATKQPLRVEPDDSAGPFLSVSIEQLPALKQVLDRHGVFYWDDGFSIALGGGPKLTYVNFGHRGKSRVSELQTLIDAGG